MAKGIELTLEQACKHPESFLYVWVSDEFLKAINSKYAKIIYTKRANQKKVLMLSADKYFGSWEKVDQYYKGIANAFVETYGVSPKDALIILAQGGEIAGKNWAEGIYGVGALTNTFKGVDANGGSVTVDAKTGHIFYNGKDITDESKTVYGNVKGETFPINYFGVDDFGSIYKSEYNKTLKKYYAASYVDDAGVTISATGKVITDSESNSIWSNINFDWDWIKSILNWILSIFNIPGIPDMEGSNSVQTLSAENTLPNQKTDGFVTQQAGMGDTGVILLCAAAAGYLMMGGKKKKKSINGCR